MPNHAKQGHPPTSAKTTHKTSGNEQKYSPANLPVAKKGVVSTPAGNNKATAPDKPVVSKKVENVNLLLKIRAEAQVLNKK